MDFDANRAFYQTMVRGVATTFTKPDDDWTPVLFMEAPGGPLVFGLFIDKEHWPGLLEQLGREKHPTFVAAVLSAWTAKRETREQVEELVNQGGVSTAADRAEIVMLQITDGKRFEVWNAPIIRFEDKPPTLGEWTQMPDGPLEGRLGDLVLHAFSAEKTDDA